jgi:hypothetical protein
MKYLAALVTRPSPSFGEFMAAAMTSDSESHAIEQGQRALARGQSEVTDFIAKLRRMTRALEKASAAGKAIDVEPIIEAMLTIERRSAADQKECQKFAKQLSKQVRQHNPEFWRRVAPLIGHFDEICADYLESIRDLRWDLMALEAKANASETGPVLQTQASVRKHMASL